MSLTGTAPLVAPLTGRDTGLADQGGTFVAQMPTLGTGVIGFATPTSQALGETNPCFLLYNGGNLNIYPLYLRIYVTVIGTTSATSGVQFTQTVDQGNRSAGTGTTQTPVISNTSIGSPITATGLNPSASKSAATILLGANVTTAATGQKRVVGHGLYRALLPGVVWDEYGFSWGSPQASGVGTVLEAATAMSKTINYPALVIGPGAFFSIAYWFASVTASPTFHYEFGYGEK
jgi:hypothetical protein